MLTAGDEVGEEILTAHVNMHARTQGKVLNYTSHLIFSEFYS
jgi:hypothetical protein